MVGGSVSEDYESSVSCVFVVCKCECICLYFTDLRGRQEERESLC